MIAGVVSESYPGESRVALVPAVAPGLTKAGLELVMESQAGLPAGYTDAEYESKKVRIVRDRKEVLQQADLLLQVRTLGANPDQGKADLEHMKSGQVLIGQAEPLTELDATKSLADQGFTLFALELMPRITRAQSMDVLSSMASIAGYKAVLLAAEKLPKMFPMMMTAAGTIKPAKVFVIGAGVAGLQAIATARRLGAVVEAYDVRPAVKEQVESLGAKFVELNIDAGTSEDKGGYAKAMGEEFYRKQRELMGDVISEMDVVITTAAIPGKKAPTLLTKEMVERMPPGSLVVDLAAERGGNCEVTQADETIEHNGVTILGPCNVPATVAYHASQMYAKNVSTFVAHLVKEGKIEIDTEDEITRDTLVCRDGDIVNNRVREAMGMDAIASPQAETKPESSTAAGASDSKEPESPSDADASESKGSTSS